LKVRNVGKLQLGKATMRLFSLCISFVLTVSLATVALAYIEQRVGQQRIAVQDGWTNSDEPAGYRAYGSATTAEQDSLSLAADTVGGR
jgi:hypothetical protein